MVKRQRSHAGRRSWWSGDFKAKCGLRFKKGRAVNRARWGMPSCPSCRDVIQEDNAAKARYKAKQRARR